jgi:hypothetical protein
VLSISHGDVNNDNKFNVADMTQVIALVYFEAAVPFPSADLADFICDKKINLADMTGLVDYVYPGGATPVKPCFEFGAIR